VAAPSEPPLSDVEIEQALRAAVVGAEAVRLPATMSKAQREKIQAELDRVRVQIAQTLEQRREIARTRERAERRAPRAPAEAPAPVAAPAAAATPAPSASAAAGAPQPELTFTVRDRGEVVGRFTGRLKAKELLQSVLSRTDRSKGEIPFALDDRNQLYVADDADGRTLERIPEVAEMRGGPRAAGETRSGREWIVVARRDKLQGLRFGIARPISGAIGELRRRTAFDFLAAFFLIGAATVGMIPLTRGMVSKVKSLEEGAARIAGGDLSTRVEVASRDEFGKLAASFNHMASELEAHQAKLLEQERIGKEREIERRLLAVENDRKSRELEEARRFQLSLLPRRLPERAGLELAVAMSTATEVGGDYYDFREPADGSLLVAIGDATGHGAAAGTMVTVVKSLFMAARTDEAPAAFLRRATGLVHGMGLSRMAMALAVARLAGTRLTISSAGMPPALHFSARRGTAEEIELTGMPLGTRAEFDYAERVVDLEPGDAVLLLSDGFPELPDATGELYGYERARALFAASAGRPATEIVAALERAAADWIGGGAYPDDVTFLVLRVV
jgi:serine phosphatase RsbU (regulator of sigma subunit)